MRCRQVRKILLEDAGLALAPAQDHLRACSSCASYLQEWEKLRTGLRRVAEEAPPEPIFGFAQRLVRSLGQSSAGRRLLDLTLVRAGRRFVYAALSAALLLSLLLLLPASGPVRSHSEAVDTAQPESIAAQNYPIFSGQLMDNDFEFAPAGSR